MALEHPKYVAAVVQAAPEFLNLDSGIEKTVALIDEAGRNGAALIAFPETWLPGYPFHVWLGPPAWALGSGFVQRYFDHSMTYDSPQADVLRAAAARNKMTVVLGLSERCGGSLYIAQWIIGPDGATVATRRKLRPTHIERTVFGDGDGDGSDLAVHDLDIGRLGALCCWEHIQPLTKYAMYAQHEQVHVAAWPSFSMYEFAPALGHEVNNAVSRVYAVEGSCFVLAPCAVISEKMVDMLCDTADKRAMIRAGGGHATAYGPDGKALVEKLPETAEGLLYVDIDLGRISLAKASADPVGHYARPDVLKLWFDKQPRRCVEHAGENDVSRRLLVPARDDAWSGTDDAQEGID
ncbi:carbon-nitrogen hydrolase family protein [Burkholderia cepacia]|uniref:carbon-nitrogen hydrolase family protein n=1 Tax=Burkholderia cepacia TaxID=292 RepID=UPI0007C71493|nr:carbon-nitrogen hydrolase family protein [Burkholderia cepacia]